MTVRRHPDTPEENWRMIKAVFWIAVGLGVAIGFFTEILPRIERQI